MANTSTMKNICSTVISEGGYQLRGRPRTVGREPNNAFTHTTAGVYYPLAALRLKSDRADGVVVLRNFTLLPIGGNSGRFRYKIISGATITGGTWVSAGTDSSVQYNISGTGMSGGTELLSGYTSVSNQSGAPLDIGGDDFLRYQLERNSFTGSNTVLVLAVACGTDNDSCVAGIDWEEMT